MSDDSPRAGLGIYAGLILVTLTTLAYQLLLTRIFSVTMLYHYTFMAVSLTMFGLTVGAIVVYLRPRWFAPSAAARRMGLAAACFAVLIVLSFLVHLRMRFVPDMDIEDLPTHFWVLAFNYSLLALPFVAGGICVTIALTRFPRQVGSLYAADLIGAGLGCLLVAIGSRWISAPTLVLVAAQVAALGAICCLVKTGARRLTWLSLDVLVGLILVGLILLTAWNATPAGRATRIFSPRWVKNQLEIPPIYERWNAFSRVGVWRASDEPKGWGMSSRFRPKEPIRQLWLNIDASAGTVLTEFHGDPSRLDYLRYDVTNVVHYIRPDSRVLIIGSGGGRDVLTALHFRQPEIVGVEINDAILETVNDYFGDFTGHLDRQPGVRFVHDEARSYLAQTDRQFDVIQISLIDTWAATAAGAYVLTENALYTREAWQRMIRRLSDRGVISCSRWYGQNGPGEIYRLTGLAVAALKELGIDDPSDHLMIVHRPDEPQDEQQPGLATLLASRKPFSSSDVETIERVADQMAFEVLLSPRATPDEVLARLASGRNLDAFFRDYPIDISPPTDDRPFFFDMLRLRDILTCYRMREDTMQPATDAFISLGLLLVAVFLLTLLCVVVPLGLSIRKAPLKGSLPLFVYFSSIGFGFMLVEVVLMQRLSVFLGHPIYSMTVVLFCLLLASGCGSCLSSLMVKDAVRGPRGPASLATLVAVLLLVGLAAIPQLARFDGAPTSVRVAIACGMLLPLGLVMGMAFPLGMRVASHRSADLTPWLFGINGATSVCGSVLAVVLSLCFGITATLLVGVACYLSAWLSFVWARQYQGSPTSTSL